ncbi:hypothetical protein H4R20_007074, partial [Coemansia guatemalensis]
MPTELIEMLAHDASLVLDSFGGNSRPLAAEPFSGTSTSSYILVLHELAVRWKALSMELHDCSTSMHEVECTGPSPFCGTLFQNHCGAAIEPHAYMWHRYLNYENGSDTNAHTHLSGAADFELPVFPSDSVYYPDPEDQLNVAVTTRVSYGRQVNQEHAQQSETSLEYPAPQPLNAIVGSHVSTSSSVTNDRLSPVLQNSTGWPRETREFLPGTWNNTASSLANDYEHRQDL